MLDVEFGIGKTMSVYNVQQGFTPATENVLLLMTAVILLIAILVLAHPVTLDTISTMEFVFSEIHFANRVMLVEPVLIAILDTSLTVVTASLLANLPILLYTIPFAVPKN